MRIGRPSVTAALLAILSLSIPASSRAQAARRVIYASALDRSGAPVSGLRPSDFVVREDKISREILSVDRASDAMQIALLVDNSRAAEQYIRDYREALPAFINQLAADDSGARHQVAIITLADRPTINTDYTFDLTQAVKGAQRIFAMSDSGSYLLDGIIETSRGIIKRAFARPIIVVVTTEGPEMSDRPYQAVLEPLRASGAAFHVITVGSRTNNSQDRSIVVDMGTRDAGGRNDNVMTGSGLTPRMKQLAAELLHQYRVTYARPEQLVPPGQITVSAVRPGLTVRGTPARDTREGL